MPAENIFAQFARPAKSVMDYMSDYDAQDLRRQQLIGAQRQNALAALTQQQTMRTMADAEGDRNALQAAAAGWNAQTTPEQRIEALRNSGRPALMNQADALEKQWIERQKATSDIGKAGSENAERDLKTATARLGQYKDLIQLASTPEMAAQALAMAHADPSLRGTPFATVPLEYSLKMLQSQPFEDWKKQWALGAEKYIEQNKPTYQQQNLGGTMQTLALPGLGGAATVAASAPITQSADNRATVGATIRAQDITDSRERALAAGKVTYQTDGNGNLVALPERVAPGTLVRGQSVVGANGMQPIPGKDAGLNDSQAKSYLFGDRMQAANKIIEGMAAKGVNRGGNINAAAGSLPFVGGAADTLTNWTQSPEQQQVKQAKLDFMTAALRRESGASIAPSEFETFDKAYFPQPNDDKMTIANKAALRQRAIDGVLVEVPQGKRPGAKQGAASASPGTVLKFDAQGNLVQ